MLNSSEEFRTVSKKGRKCKYKNSDKTKHSADTIDKEYTKRRLSTLRKDISSSEYFKEVSGQLETSLNSLNHEKIQQLVCFGIGSFGSCLIALHQLAFILEIMKTFHIPDNKFYDPIFTETEKHILQELGCNLMPENCEGKYLVDCITVFYLPHCPKQLTNNLLWRNWSAQRLNHIIIIGNSFENTKRNVPERFLKEDAGYLLRISDFVTEIPLVNNFQFEDVFNDMAIHLFSDGNMWKIDGNEWLDCIEPKYGDTELITLEIEMNLSIR